MDAPLFAGFAMVRKGETRAGSFWFRPVAQKLSHTGWNPVRSGAFQAA
jgi:hypothetical protein